MLLDKLIHRALPPEPWAEGDNIPWNDPEFSERMLREHLSQAHDAASRRLEIILRQVDWILSQTGGAAGLNILDLACGPGLYASELARRGHTCTGIDFSPASIRHARQLAAAENLPCTYHLADLRQADFGENFDLALFIYGEFNVFTPATARRILTKAHAALRPGGLLIIEPHTFEFVRRQAQAAPVWFTSPGGLFAAEPHLVLQENFWDADAQAGTSRYYVVTAADAALTQFAASYQAYTEEAYRQLLTEAGFAQVQFHPSLTGEPALPTSPLMALTARKTRLSEVFI
jgi:SAM-dependent methyltransferase